MQEFSIEVKRTARFCTIGKPGPGLKRVWLVCHGYGYLAADFIRYFDTLDNGENLIVVPEGLSRFYLKGVSGRIGASWMTKEARQHEIHDYVHYLDAVCSRVFSEIKRDEIKFVAMGFSQGTATICRWLNQGNTPADALVLWAGDIPHEIDTKAQLERFRSIDITIVYGEQDMYATRDRIERHAKFLKEHKIDYHLMPFKGGHEINNKVLLQLARRLA